MPPHAGFSYFLLIISGLATYTALPYSQFSLSYGGSGTVRRYPESLIMIRSGSIKSMLFPTVIKLLLRFKALLALMILFRGKVKANCEYVLSILLAFSAFIPLAHGFRQKLLSKNPQHLCFWSVDGPFINWVLIYAAVNHRAFFTLTIP